MKTQNPKESFNNKANEIKKESKNKHKQTYNSIGFCSRTDFFHKNEKY